ncbi:hypothetical protein GWK47_034108 [Chionoecetes opilio]|uniref:Uncharacterized protein n=1 Tax=Chionoecetes opilio TaxID=41210 RepID=A0A8J4YV08_CHIOP|nr:hypothetical protein GWK47_034108 [Chionoecetes opilio]
MLRTAQNTSGESPPTPSTGSGPFPHLDPPPQDPIGRPGNIRAAARQTPSTPPTGLRTSGFPPNGTPCTTSIPYWKFRGLLVVDGEWSCMARELFPAGPRRPHPCGYTTAPRCRSHAPSAAHRLSSGQVSMPTLPRHRPSLRAMPYLQPSKQQDHYCATNPPLQPFESISADFFSVAGKSFLVYRGQTFRVAFGRPLRGRYYRPRTNHTPGLLR